VFSDTQKVCGINSSGPIGQQHEWRTLFRSEPVFQHPYQHLLALLETSRFVPDPLDYSWSLVLRRLRSLGVILVPPCRRSPGPSTPDLSLYPEQPRRPPCRRGPGILSPLSSTSTPLTPILVSAIRPKITPIYSALLWYEESSVNPNEERATAKAPKQTSTQR
jgi:hypothetical protein